MRVLTTSLLLASWALFYPPIIALSSTPSEIDPTSECSHSKVLILYVHAAKLLSHQIERLIRRQRSGAGMAGISAGRKLTQHGIDDFKIIEYQDRVGGRTLHTTFGQKRGGSSYTVELGTNWACIATS